MDKTSDFPNSNVQSGATAPYPPAYPADNNYGSQNYQYPPVSEAYPPLSTAYPPVPTAYPTQNAYPPSTTGYPPQNPYPPTTTGYPTQNPYGSPESYPDVDPPPYTVQNQTQTQTVVIITDPPQASSIIPNDYSPQIGFNSKSVRLGFIRRVFAIFSIQLLVTVGFICLFMFVPSVKEAGRNLSIYLAAYAIFFVLYFVLVCCDNVRRNHPFNLILLSLFTLSLSYLVGVITSYHETSLVLIMMGVTAAVSISISLFACQTKFDMTKFGGVLFVLALVMFFVLIFTPAFILLTTVGRIAIGGVMALIFAAFMVYDIQLVMGGRKYELSEEEYVFGALIIYMDIVNLFLILLYMFGGKN